MIPRADITAWRTHAPWAEDAQVEQDLVITRAMVALFADETVARSVAMRGGTALNKLYFTPARRFSEDIDLVQLRQERIGALLDAIHAQLDPWLGKPRWKQTAGRVTLYYPFTAEVEQTPRQLKVEINVREHMSVYGVVTRPLAVGNPWFSGQTNVVTYALDELLGTKLRALYQRRKGRDLLDLYLAIDARHLSVQPERVVRAFREYLALQGLTISRRELEQNLAEKLRDRAFREGVAHLLPAGDSFDPDHAHDVVRRTLIERLDRGMEQFQPEPGGTDRER